jgi:hypothetical protein
LAAIALAIAWTRIRVRRLRLFGQALNRALEAEAAADNGAVELTLAEARRHASRLGRIARPGAYRALDCLSARLLYRQGHLDAAADLSYELLHRARAGT